VTVQPRTIYIGSTPQQHGENHIAGEYVTLLGESFYCIRHYDAMPPFFMTIVSSSDHWLFVGSQGGVSAGRVNADHALFPYYTVDKITDSSDHTGSKTILLVTRDACIRLWEPFSERYRAVYSIERNLYKNIPGTTVIFEEINHDLDLTFRYAWRTSDAYGFVKTSWLINQGHGACEIEIIDGLQNLLPTNVNADVQNTFSMLLDAYKRSELELRTGLGIFTLSSRLTDGAEPSESLGATTVWQTGLEAPQYLLSSTQLDSLRHGQPIQQEVDIRGQRSAYFVHTSLALKPQSERSWHLVAEVDQDSVAVTHLINELSGDKADLTHRVERDIAASSQKLEAIVARADGLQTSGDRASTAHHFANVLFNVMRGGVFADDYQIDSADLQEFIAVHNRNLLADQRDFFASLPPTIQVHALRALGDSSGSTVLIRLCYSYLPLTFSRRHGDPSRPWNRFSIHVRKPDGAIKLDYEGNWRDIFQNWEALAYSYPEFILGMISTFLNATTVEGYNPYRITRNGINWEVPEPSNPWANIGYWSDHQIIYLQKLMEVCAKFYPGALESLLTRSMFSHANVPYRIKIYDTLLNDPYATVAFDRQKEHEIKARVKALGSDGKLVLDSDGKVFHVTLLEKLLILLLAKLVNFVPEGGLWMNTQRPEWNDANNALVGKGLSVVTLGYLRRYLMFVTELVAACADDHVVITRETQTLFGAIGQVLARYSPVGPFSDEQRRAMMDALGQAGSDYRWNYYEHGLSGEFASIALGDLNAFFRLAQQYIEQTLRANKRSDNLYHAYNTLHLSPGKASVAHLYEMLEGQVSILSSGLLTADESLTLLRTIRRSALYRADQHSYLLYPNRTLPGFLQKNAIDASKVADLKLVAALVQHRDQSLIVKDINGVYHFSQHIRNARDVAQALTALGEQTPYTDLVATESDKLLALFEQVFHHQAFTGRAGTFFAYEGLGSIYWHMVSKLLLATQEALLNAVNTENTPDTIGGLMEAYFDIRQGLGFNKTPDVYGAFPTDPYSHSPEGQGAKQPGMTGMVKEEILTRLAEVGLMVEDGSLLFNPLLVRSREFLTAPSMFRYFDVDGQEQRLELPAGSFGYTFCQVPIVLQIAELPQIIVLLGNQSTEAIPGDTLPAELCKHIFARDGVVRQLTVFIKGVA
jgi:hypothetical protein